MVGAAGVALLMSLFLDWYGVKGVKTGLSAWDAFDVVDVVLLVVALSAIALAVVTALQRTPAIPVAMASIVTILAFVALILVVYRAIDEPDAYSTGVLGTKGVALDLSLSGGLWLALASSLAMLTGGALAIRDERPGAPVPPVEAEELPAPAP